MAITTPTPIIPPIPPKPTLVNPKVTLIPLQVTQPIPLQPIPLPDKPTIPAIPEVAVPILPHVHIVQHSAEVLPALNQLYTYLLDDSEWLFMKEGILRKYLQTKDKLFNEESKKGHYYISGASQKVLVDLQTSERMDMIAEYSKYFSQKNSVAMNIVKQIVNSYWELQELMFRENVIQTNFDIEKNMSEIKFKAEQTEFTLKAQLQNLKKVIDIETSFNEIQALVVSDISNQVRLETEKVQDAVVRAAYDSLTAELLGVAGRYQASVAQLETLSVEAQLLQSNLQLVQSMLYEAAQEEILLMANLTTEQFNIEFSKQKLNIAKMDIFKEQVAMQKKEFEVKILRAEVILLELLSALEKFKVKYESTYDKYRIEKERLEVAVREAAANLELSDARFDSLVAAFAERLGSLKESYLDLETYFKTQATKMETDVQVQHTDRLKRFMGTLEAAVAQYDASIQISAADRIAEIEIGSKITANLIHTLRG